MASVSLRKLDKSYGALRIVKGIDLEINDGEFVVFVGPSGCGKSTTLRMVAGLESISGGEVMIGDRVVNKLPPRERDIAMVFQDYALYPHKTVRENMGFSLKVRGVSASQANASIDEAANMLGISHLLDRRPGQLSGGQRQRVAMGRAIVRRPQVFLFDEPLSNLDAKLRGQVRTEIKRLHQQLGTTIIYVTHDQVEAMTLADRIVVFKDGHIEQIGTPVELYKKPANLFVAQFIGSPAMNILAGTISEAAGRNYTCHLDCGTKLALQANDGSFALDDRVSVGIRPENTRMSHDETEGPVFSGSVDLVEHLGEAQIVYIDMAGSDTKYLIKTPEEADFKLSDIISFTASKKDIHVFSKEGAAVAAQVL